MNSLSDIPTRVKSCKIYSLYQPYSNFKDDVKMLDLFYSFYIIITYTVFQKQRKIILNESPAQIINYNQSN